MQRKTELRDNIQRLASLLFGVLLTAGCPAVNTICVFLTAKVKTLNTSRLKAAWNITQILLTLPLNLLAGGRNHISKQSGMFYSSVFLYFLGKLWECWLPVIFPKLMVCQCDYNILRKLIVHFLNSVVVLIWWLQLGTFPLLYLIKEDVQLQQLEVIWTASSWQRLRQNWTNKLLNTNSANWEKLDCKKEWLLSVFL